jgi:hypothetical protein
MFLYVKTKESFISALFWEEKTPENLGLRDIG